MWLQCLIPFTAIYSFAIISAHVVTKTMSVVRKMLHSAISRSTQNYITWMFCLLNLTCEIISLNIQSRLFNPFTMGGNCRESTHDKDLSWSVSKEWVLGGRVVKHTIIAINVAANAEHANAWVVEQGNKWVHFWLHPPTEPSHHFVILFLFLTSIDFVRFSFC